MSRLVCSPHVAEPDACSNPCTCSSCNPEDCLLVSCVEADYIGGLLMCDHWAVSL